MSARRKAGPLQLRRAIFQSDTQHFFFQTAEIIALLYEATLGPTPTIDVPALNPTSGVKVNPPIGGLVYKKDSSRPGGGIFVAQGGGNYGQLPDGLYINDNNGSEGKALPSLSPPLDNKPSTFFSWSSIGSLSNFPAASPQRVSQHETSASLSSSNTEPSTVNAYTSSGLAGADQNVNPVMNSSVPGNVQVMNVLDVPQASNTLEQFAMADIGLLEGIPGGMFDWGK
jgi:hypothetical protein